MQPWYATREQVQDSLEIMHTARSASLIDAALEAATPSVESLLHRRFYPETKTVTFDWPSNLYTPSWQLLLGDNEIVSLTTLTAGGVVIPATDYFLRRWDNRDEPPYQYIEIDRSSSAAFQAGTTSQRAIEAYGVFGHNATDTSVAGGYLGIGINSSTTSLRINPSGGVFTIGVGSIIVIGTERMIVTSRAMTDTTENVQSTMTASVADTLVDVTNGSWFSVGETILVDAERMRIVDIAGNNLIVIRAWDGSTLAAHSALADVYASWSFTASRGALGSTAAAHSSADLVYVHKFPGLINELAKAEAVVMLEQNSSAYARVVGAGSSARESVGKGLEDLRARAVTAYGRKCRQGAI